MGREQKAPGLLPPGWVRKPSKYFHQSACRGGDCQISSRSWLETSKCFRALWAEAGSITVESRLLPVVAHTDPTYKRTIDSEATRAGISNGLRLWSTKSVVNHDVGRLNSLALPNPKKYFRVTPDPVSPAISGKRSSRALERAC